MPITDDVAIRRAENELIIDTPWGHFNVQSTQDPAHPATHDLVGNTARTQVGGVQIGRVGVDWEPVADGTGSPSVWWEQSPLSTTPLVVLIRESDGAELRPVLASSWRRVYHPSGIPGHTADECPRC